MNRAAALRDRASRARARIAEIAATTPRSEYHESELRQELAEMRAHERAADRGLIELSAPPRPGDVRRREAVIEQRMRERGEHISRFVEQLEAEGDHRQARIWRGQLVGLRETIEREVQ